ncbi:Ger(x)C family spore germination protein [Metabacillus litoralis]|uniref:Ger(X)C family spore germination protein n=1 Tax=Metabacillus litoralis TaxID=152268 RepID=A0A5C6VK77_9BACI|nr:Ger(x)C family spore germination protein [Metabacillus litoralis]TXC85972.1 Ger(x)C family spore germination protein [Metabacillus litoralis]
MRKWKFFIVIFCLFITSGCWDSIEIEERGFVIGVGVDLNEETEDEGPLSLSQQFVIPTESSQGGSGEGGSGDAFQNIVSSGNTIFETVRRVAARTNRSPFYEHIKLIVVSEELAKSDHFPDILDYFLRYPEMRRGTQIMVTPEKAGDILEITPKNEKLPAIYIKSISKNNYKNARMVPPTRIGKIHENLLGDDSYMIQMIVKLNPEEVKISGQAVFNGYTDKLVGFIEEDATEGVNFITGELKGGLLEAKVKDEIVVYEMDKVKTDIEPVYEKGKIKFNVTIKTTGTIPESYKSFDLLDEEEINQTEEAIKDKIHEFTKLAIKKVRDDLKTDIFGFSQKFRVKYPNEWEDMKNDWDIGENYFQQSEIEVNVNTVVDRSGTIIRSSLEE